MTQYICNICNEPIFGLIDTNPDINFNYTDYAHRQCEENQKINDEAWTGGK